MAPRETDGRILDDGKESGMVETFFFDPTDNSFTIETSQDVTPYLDVAHALDTSAPARWGEWSHVAIIPNVILTQLIRQGILGPGGAIQDDQRFRAWLNDRDNQAFRTRPGTV